MRAFLIFIFAICSSVACYGQVGLTASPIKLYFHLSAGESGTQIITVSNPTNSEVEVGVSFRDWNYNELGNNQISEAGTLKTSCADWIRVLPASYFVLQSNGQKKLKIEFNVPSEANQNIPVQTCLLFLTQLNPTDGGVDKSGAAILVTVRIGVKIYNSFYTKASAGLEIIDFNTFDNKEGKRAIYITLENTGKIWVDGIIQWQLFNKGTGQKMELEKTGFYTLPGDKRRLQIALPADLKKGDYVLTAIVKYNEDGKIKVADLSFTY